MRPAISVLLRLFLLALPGFSSIAIAQNDEAVELLSPDGGVQLRVSIQEKLNSEGSRLYYSLSYQGQTVLLDSAFGLDFKGAPPFATGLTVLNEERRTVSEDWQRYWGKRSEVNNHYNELSLDVQETEAPNRRLTLIFRAFDDGLAFRYHLPADWGEFKLSAEQSHFQFTGDAISWAVKYDSYQTSQEVPFLEMPLHELEASSLYGLPLLVQASPTVWAAISEANLTDWAGMYLQGSGADRNTVISSLSPRPDEPDVIVHSTAPRDSPWRMVMVGDSAGSLIESDMLHNLNAPPAEDFSWVEPGTASWNWWNGPYMPDANFEVGMNTATMKAFVDLSARMNWEYVLVDAGWYVFGSPGGDDLYRPESDITEVVPALDMPELIRYAAEKDVKVIVWLHWGSVDLHMEEAFPVYEEWGVAGVKIDFMNRDDQAMVNYYHRVVKLAAEHHLLVNFHGAYKPTGVSRTYPNLITREGVLGNEYNKWSNSVSLEHTVTIPFTRGLLGEMDFTPGGFRNKTVDGFRPIHIGPSVMGTRVHELAMFIVYESALRVASDSPYSYAVSPAGTDFLKVVPSSWDDTQVPQGEPGDFIVVARRAGEEWFVGSMSDERPRNLQISLDFLGEGSYRAEIWADAYEARQFPDRLIKQEMIVTASDTIEAVMAPGGGHIIHLQPME